MKTVAFILACVCASQAFLFDDPCGIFPTYEQPGIPSDPNYTTSVKVLPGCMNGTFRWDYPVGHVIVTFSNPKHDVTSVCFKDSLNGLIFTFIDKTAGAGDRVLGQYTEQHWACTGSTTERDIVLQVDAPPDMYYMGAVDYRLQTSPRRGIRHITK